MANINFNFMDVDDSIICTHGDFIISNGCLCMVVPYAADSEYVLVNLHNGCTVDRSINIKGLTLREIARKHKMYNYSYVGCHDAEMTFSKRQIKC